MVALGPWHGWLLLATAAAPDPDHGDPYAWIKAIERDGGAHTLPAGTLEIDRQYILQAGTTIVGATWLTMSVGHSETVKTRDCW